MTVTGPYRYTYGREPDLDKRCDTPHPAFPATKCNRTRGHYSAHRYTSPADGRSVEWDDNEETPF